MIAAARGDTEMLTALAAGGADLDAQNAVGYNALMLAARKGKRGRQPVPAMVGTWRTCARAGHGRALEVLMSACAAACSFPPAAVRPLASVE